MKTIPLPDTFPAPLYQLGQVVRMLRGQITSQHRTPIVGLIVGLMWINPETADALGYHCGWAYLLSFADMPGLPEGFEHNLSEASDWALEADIETAPAIPLRGGSANAAQ
jgi:hypothetical protein